MAQDSSKWDWANDPSNPAAYPVMATFGMFGGWSIAEWMQWHAVMKSACGLYQANVNFLTAWADDGILEGPPLDARSFNTDFREYAKANGFFDGLYYGLGVLAKPLGGANDIVDASSKVASSLSTGIETTGKIAGMILPAAIIVAGAIIAAPYVAPHIKRALKAVK